MATRRPDLPQPDLSLDTIAVLLGGFGAHPPEPGPFTGFSGGFLDLYDPENAGIIRLWTAHRDWLIAQAAAWGWAPEWVLPSTGEALFYGAWVTRGGPAEEQAAHSAAYRAGLVAADDDDLE